MQDGQARLGRRRIYSCRARHQYAIRRSDSPSVSRRANPGVFRPHAGSLRSDHGPLLPARGAEMIEFVPTIGRHSTSARIPQGIADLRPRFPAELMLADPQRVAIPAVAWLSAKTGASTSEYG